MNLVTPDDQDTRFHLLCTEIAATAKGERGHIAPQHLVEMRDHLIPRIHRIRNQINRDRARAHVTHGEVDELWSIFTDITGIDEPCRT